MSEQLATLLTCLVTFFAVGGLSILLGLALCRMRKETDDIEVRQ